MSNRRVALIILDGIGMTPRQDGNAFLAAQTPMIDALFENFNPVLIQASGESVGLPFGEMGNSEVGHLSLGAGRVVAQDFTLISNAIQDGSFFTKPVFQEAVQRAREKQSNFHIMGILTESGVHGFLDHMLALLELASRSKLSNVFLHLFTDGRDTPPQSAKKFIEKINQKITVLKTGQIATLIGRYYAMDRDKRWERTKRAYDLLTQLKGKRYASALEALADNYQNGKNDEFLEPSVVEGAQPISSNDSVVFINFRADRAIQISQALASDNFIGFQRQPIKDLKLVTFTFYNDDIKAQEAFTSFDLNNPNSNPLNHCLGEIISTAGLTQVHAAETEKFAHVTYFFNAARKEVFPGEKHLLVHSPKVATYDQQPSMSAPELTDKFIQFVNAKKPTFALLNFANGDMVGHTGNLKAATQAIEVVDKQLARIIERLIKDYQVIVTADHGNAEEMINLNGQILKEHSTNPVPFVFVNQSVAPQSNNETKLAIASQEPVGLLADVAPTVLAILGLDKPPEMNGESLV